jgi:hypothetical protein
MVAVAEAHPSVGVVSAYERCGEKIRITGLPTDQTIVTGREACREFLLDRLLLFGSQNSVMYRADLVRSRDPFYVETDNYADFESCFALLKQSDLGFVHQILTFSRPRPQSIGAISADIGSHYRSVLGLLFTYGRDSLANDEFKKRLDRTLSEYYRFLGRRLWVERDATFWSYHKEAFAQLGIPFRRSRLFRAALGQLFGSVLTPKSTMESLKRMFLLRKIRDWKMRRVILDAENSPKFRADAIENGEEVIGRP